MDQKTTSELLGILSRIDSEKDLAEYTEHAADAPHQSFSDYFTSLEKVKEQKRSDLIRRIGILYARNRRDAILIFCINKELSVTDTEELIDRMGETTLQKTF